MLVGIALIVIATLEIVFIIRTVQATWAGRVHADGPAASDPPPGPTRRAP